MRVYLVISNAGELRQAVAGTRSFGLAALKAGIPILVPLLPYVQDDSRNRTNDITGRTGFLKDK